MTDAPIAGRTYGINNWSLDEAENWHTINYDITTGSDVIRDMVAHLRQLEAENAKLRANQPPRSYRFD